MPLPVGPSEAALEFGSGELLDEDIRGVDPSAAIEALLKHILHETAAGRPPQEAPAILDMLLEAHASGLPDRVLRLALQVYGRLGEARDFWPGRCSVTGSTALYASWLRYLSETGSGSIDEIPGDLWPLTRVYAARCATPRLLAALAGDPSWAVRHEVASRSDSTEVLAILAGDGCGAVALAALGRMKDLGMQGWREGMERLTETGGPIGIQAIALLDSGSAGLLSRELSSDSPGRRLSALTAWLSSGLLLDAGRRDSLLSDPYWVIPMTVLEDIARTDSSLAASAAAEILDTLSTPPGEDLRVSLEQFIGIGPAPAVPWLPFDPTLVQVPETLVLVTDVGDFTIELWREEAPVHCAALAWLASRDFYDGIEFHRVIPGFVAQGGCPEDNGMGGPGFSLPNERSLAGFSRGVVGMADAGLDTGGSQFFIMLDDHDRLDCRYTAFGKVVGGLERLDEITVGTRMIDVATSVPHGRQAP